MSPRAHRTPQLIHRTGIALVIVTTGYVAWDILVGGLSSGNAWRSASEWLQPKWQVLSSRQSSVPDGLSFLTLSLRRASDKVQCFLVLFHESEFELLVVDNGPSRATPRFRSLKDAVNQLECEAGTNGGFFDIGSFAPNGLMVANGRSTGEFQRDNWADGVVIVRAHRPVLEHRDAFVPGSSVTDMLQTGPWLVRDGKACSKFTDDTIAHRRTFIATDGQGTWLLGHVSGITLSDLGRILCSEPLRSIMPVRDALNLDGGPSSGFYVRTVDSTSVYIEEETIVRNFLGLRRRSSPIQMGADPK